MHSYCSDSDRVALGLLAVASQSIIQGIDVLHMTIEELSDLTDSVATLEVVLAKLDRIGAGIAAIHVDAAIGQLRNNLEIIADENWQPRDAQTCPSEYPLVSR